MNDNDHFQDVQTRITRLETLSQIVNEPKFLAIVAEFQQTFDDFFPRLCKILEPLGSEMVQVRELIGMPPGMTAEELRTVIPTDKQVAFAVMLTWMGELCKEAQESLLTRTPQTGT